jgi:hypothetical protein
MNMPWYASSLDVRLSDLEANLLALMGANRPVQDKRRAEQAAVDLEADKEIVSSGQNRARIADATMSDLVTRLPQETVLWTREREICPRRGWLQHQTAKVLCVARVIWTNLSNIKGPTPQDVRHRFLVNGGVWVVGKTILKLWSLSTTGSAAFAPTDTLQVAYPIHIPGQHRVQFSPTYPEIEGRQVAEDADLHEDGDDVSPCKSMPETAASIGQSSLSKIQLYGYSQAFGPNRGSAEHIVAWRASQPKNKAAASVFATSLSFPPQPPNALVIAWS